MIDRIVAPITVNLLTALIIFLCVVFFKKPIYQILGPEPVELYPLQCIGEPYTDEKGFLVSDLFVINLTGDELSEKDLIFFLKSSVTPDADEQGRPDIELAWNSDIGPGKITDVDKLDKFNDGKGRIEITEPQTQGGPWGIRIRELRPKAIIKIFISTNIKIEGVTRTSKYFSPFKILYPGE